MEKTALDLLKEYRDIVEGEFFKGLQGSAEHVTTIDSNEFDRFIKSVYGHSYEVIADEEWDNDSSHEFNVKKKPWGSDPLDKYDVQKLETFVKTGRSSYLAHILFRDLCNRDLIAPGKYLIKVFW